MPNTYTQIHIQVVFAVQSKVSLINKKWESALYKYISGIIQHYKHKVLIIYGMPDHIHILIGMRPNQSLSELMKYVKQDSTKWINRRQLIYGRFSWQAGFGAFSYSKSQLPRVVAYIKNQKEHHKRLTFREEYEKLLKVHGIDYDLSFIFKELT